MLRREMPFVVATVIRVRGSAVAKPGAKSIIDAEGRPVFGWVGGGCVESFVCSAAKEALAEASPRVVTADLEDELSGVGLPCGGVMEIFIEPVMPRRRVLVTGENDAARHASEILERIGFAVASSASDVERDSLIMVEARAGTGLDLGGASLAEAALSVVAEMLATVRKASARPLQEMKTDEPLGAFESASERVSQPTLVIAGHSNITEELAWMAARVGWRVILDSTTALEESYPEGVRIVRDDADFSQLPASADTAVVVATHHKGDHLAIERAVAAGAWYVGLVTSAHRSRLVRAMLEDSLHGDARLKILRAPAGLDLGATTPAEIALSIMCEVLACFHGRAGQNRLR
ncbi:MAG TPA: XdhC family protein [Pyrinomonadaceae bacterium]|nr:XdhC family protein [Pyrinomonadaceae bacterium]